MKKERRVELRFNENQFKKLKALSRKYDISVSEYIRKAVFNCNMEEIIKASDVIKKELKRVQKLI